MALKSLSSHLASLSGVDRLSYLHLAFEDEAATLKLALDRPVWLGRTGQVAEGRGIDLTPFGAQEKGVSLKHAKIFKRDDFIWIVDLDSLNGTFLNNHRLLPQSPFVLNDGACLQLGLLQIKVGLSRSSPGPNTRFSRQICSLLRCLFG